MLYYSQIYNECSILVIEHVYLSWDSIDTINDDHLDKKVTVIKHYWLSDLYIGWIQGPQTRGLPGKNLKKNLDIRADLFSDLMGVLWRSWEYLDPLIGMDLKFDGALL